MPFGDLFIIYRDLFYLTIAAAALQTRRSTQRQLTKPFHNGRTLEYLAVRKTVSFQDLLAAPDKQCERIIPYAPYDSRRTSRVRG